MNVWQRVKKKSIREICLVKIKFEVRKRDCGMLEYKYKYKDEDFRVNEILNLVTDGGIYNCYILRKKGFRTVDVIDSIAANNDIDLANITYAGLKDEDAVTMQHIAIKGRKIDNCKVLCSGKQYELYFIGASEYPIEIGKLQGNSFKLRLRNLEKNVANAIKKWEKHSFTILNYFGVQRFGMPEKDHITHWIGKNIIENRYEEAFKQLYSSGNIDEAMYKQWINDTEIFIKNIVEPRRRTFYLSAYDSYIWNNTIGEVIRNNCSCNQYEKAGIDFFYSDDIMDSVRKKLEEIPIVWHRYDENGEIFEKESFRQPYINLIYRASDLQNDDEYKERYMIEIDFVLPAGSYATNAVDQLMYILENRMMVQDKL